MLAIALGLPVNVNFHTMAPAVTLGALHQAVKALGNPEAMLMLDSGAPATIGYESPEDVITEISSPYLEAPMKD